MKKLKITSALILICSLSFSQYYKVVPVDQATEDITGRIRFNSPTQNFSFNTSSSEVDMYTGRPVFTIPIYTLKSKTLEVPVSLTYISNGVLVEKQSNWTGMDWNLNAGGIIVREVKGIPDETPTKGFWAYGREKSTKFYNDMQVGLNYNAHVLSYEAKSDIISNVGTHDLEPDVFHYKFMNYSGKFYITNGYDFVFIPYQPFKVEKTIDSQKRISGFTITTPEGTMYKFGISSDAIEYTKIVTITSDFVKVFETAKNIKEKNFTSDFFSSQWHLSQIKAQNNDQIDFVYSDEINTSYVDAPRITRAMWDVRIEGDKAYRRCWSLSIEGLGNVGGGEETVALYNKDNYYNYSYSQTKYYKKLRYLKSIKNLNGDHIDFTLSSRNDNPGDFKLDKISICNNSNTFLKLFKLEYDEIVSETFNPSEQTIDPFSYAEAFLYKNINFNWANTSAKIPASLAYSYESSIPYKETFGKYLAEGLKPYNYKRLFLKKVTELSSSKSYPSYVFEYITPEKLPRKTSIFVDRWGFAIESNNTGDYSTTYGKKLQGASGLPWKEIRSNPLNVSRAGLLSSIVIPSGGRIEYVYENNDYNAGSRVREIIQTTNDIPQINSFEYTNPLSILLPNFSFSLGFMHELWDPGNLDPSEDFPNGEYNTDNKTLMYGLPMLYHCSYNIGIQTNVNGCFLGYKNVTKSNKNIDNQPFGYETFEYDNTPDQHQHQYYSLWSVSTEEMINFHCHLYHRGIQKEYFKRFKILDSHANVGNLQNNSNFNEYVDQSHKRGKLKNHQVFNINSSVPVKETIYNYNESYPANPREIFGLKGSKYVYMNRIDYEWSKYAIVLDRCDICYVDRYMRLVDLYKLESKIQYMDNVIERTYSTNDPTKYIENTTKYTYNGYGLPQTITAFQSDGSKVIKRIKYVNELNSECDQLQDCINNAEIAKIDCERNCEFITNPVDKSECLNNCNASSNTIIDDCYFVNDPNNGCASVSGDELTFSKMVLKNMIVSPIEEQTIKSIGDQDYLVSGNITKYKEVSSNIIVPAAMYSIDQKFPSTDLVEANLGLNDLLLYHPNYMLKHLFDNYDDKGNLLQHHAPNDINISYVWGYNKTKPIAEVKNAKSTEIYFNGFEDGPQTNNTDSHSGKYAGRIKNSSQFIGVVDFLKSNLTSGKYVYSGWFKTIGSAVMVVKDLADNNPWHSLNITNTGGVWKYYEMIVDINDPVFNGCTTVRCEIYSPSSSDVLVDDIRFRPLNSIMTSYTFDPLIGMTSKTDENNRTTYYEYDDFGRLKTVKDDDGNILNHYQYRYHEVNFSLINTLTSNNSYRFDITGDDINSPSLSFEWNFGDGQSVNTTTPTTTHTYSSSSGANYTVTVIVKSNGNIVKTLSTTVNSLGECTLSAMYLFDCDYQLRITGSNFNGANYTYEWNMGDGTVLNNNLWTMPYSFNATQTLNRYTVTVKIKYLGTVIQTLQTFVRCGLLEPDPRELLPI